MSADLDILRIAARWRLPAPAPEPVTLDGHVDRLLEIARQDRLGPMLAGAMRDGWLVVDDGDVRARILDVELEQLVASVLVESALLDVADVFDRARVRWRVSKGSAFAHLDYPDPALRPFGDVDVIVHGDSWNDAIAAAAEAGWRRDLAELAPGFDADYGKGATLRDRDDLELDLHRRLAVGRFGLRLDTASFFDDVEPFPVAGRWLPAPSPPMRLLHACFHGALGGFRVLRVHRDVAQMLLGTRVDWQRTVDVARASRVDAVVARAVVDAWSNLALDVHHPCVEWASRRVFTRWERRVLEVFAEERPYAAQALTAVPDLIGRGATRYLVALAGQSGRGGLDARDLVRRGRLLVGRARR